MADDDGIATEALYFDMAKILQSMGHCAPFSKDENVLFAKILHQTLKSLGWPLTPASFSPEQLNHLGTAWNNHLTAESDADLSDDLFGSNAPHSREDMTKFSLNIDRFCTHYKMQHPLPEAVFPFIKEFLTRPPHLTHPSSVSPKGATGKMKVWFSEPPIATINDPAPMEPMPKPQPSAVPVPDSEEFPALAGKPFGDTWATVTKHRKKKKRFFHRSVIEF